MAKIGSARAFANNEVAFISWNLREMIPGCLGFDVVRIMVEPSVDGPEEPKGLATWVPFEDQLDTARHRRVARAKILVA